MAGEASAPPSLLEEARTFHSRKGPACDVDRFYIARPDLAAELRAALASEVLSTAIIAALSRRGVDLSYSSIQRHRRGACRCQTY